MRNVQDPLALANIRPRFTITSGFTPEQIHQKLDIALQNEKAICHGHATKRYANIFLPINQQHFWSPMLKVSYEEDELDETLTEVRGHFGPKPSIWTMFLFFYFFIAISGLFILIIWYSNYSIGKESSIIWALPLNIILFISLYLVSYFGRKKSRNQLLILHDFFVNATGIKI